MRLSTSTLLISGLAANQVAATWDRYAPSFKNPYNANNECTDKQKSGYGWSDLPTGNFDSYDDFSFQGGWSCANSFGKRDALTKRTFNSKCVKTTVSKSGGKSFSCSKSTGFSLDELQVSVEFDCNLEFHYGMEDGSTCKQVSPCKAEGTIVKNTQCGGAKTVQVYLGDHQQKKDTCDIGIHHVGFNCDSHSSSSVVYSTPAPSSAACTPGQYGCTPLDSSSSPIAASTPAPSSAGCTPGQYGCTPLGPSSSVPASTPTPYVSSGTPEVPSSTSEAPGSTGTPGVYTSIPVESSAACTPGQYGCTPPESSSPIIVSTPEVPSSTPGAPSSTPAVPSSTPEVQSSTPEVPSSAPSSTPGAPSSTPEVPSSIPGAPSSAPAVPSSTPEAPSSTPGAPSSTPAVPSSTPEVPYSIPSSAPGAPSSAPGAPSSAPGAPSSIPGAPSSSPAVPSSTPEVPSSAPGAPSSAPGAPSSTPAIYTSVPESSAIAASTAACTPGQYGCTPIESSSPSTPESSAAAPSGPASAPGVYSSVIIPGESSSVAAASTAASSVIAPSQVPSSNCPGVLPQCMNTWITLKSQCKDNTDFSCYCKNPDFTKSVIDCVSAWGVDSSEVQAALSYLAGICAPFVPQNPGIITDCPSTVTLGPTVPVAASTPVYTAPAATTAVGITSFVTLPAPGASSVVSSVAPVASSVAGYTAPVTTITLVATVTVPCTGAGGSTIIGSSTTTTTTTLVTVPQVAFTTYTPAAGATITQAVNLAPGTPAPVYASATSSFGTIVQPSGSGVYSSGLPQFTGAASSLNAGSFAPAALGAIMALFVL